MTTLLTNRAVRLSAAEAFCTLQFSIVHGKISENPVKAWKEKIDSFMNSSQCREFGSNRLGVDGWKNFSGFTTLQILAEIQNMMTEIQCESEQFSGRIIFMSMYNDIVWGEKGNEDLCIANSQIVAEYARRVAHGHWWSFLGLGSEKKWYGTHTCKPNGKWDGVAEDMMLNFSESGHPAFRGSGALERGDLKKQSKGQIVYTLLWRRQNRWKWFFAQSFPSISSHSLRRSSGHVRRTGLQNLWLFRKDRETCCTEHFRDHGDANRKIVDNEQNASDQWQSARKLACCTIDHLQSIKLCSNVGRHHEDRGEGTVFHDPRRCGTWHIWRSREGEGEELMSSVYSTSRQRSIQSKRMNLWEHEDRSSFGGGSVSPSRLLRHRDHVRLLIRWWNLSLCADREWNKQIRDGNDAGNTREPHRWHWRQYRETCCKSKTKNKHQCRRLLLQRSRYHTTRVLGLTSNQVSTTRVVSKCQRRWSDCFDTILQYFEKKTEQSNSESWHRWFVQNLRLLSIGLFEHGWITCKKEEVLRRDVSIVWIHILLIPSCTFEQFKAALEENTLILHCRATCCYRATLPSTSTTFETSTIRTRSFDQDYFRVAKTSRKGDMRCYLRPWTQRSSTTVEKGITTWRSPGLQCTNTNGKYTKTPCIDVMWWLLRVKDCSSIKRDQKRSSFTSLYLRCASRRWWSGSQEKNCTAKRTTLQLYRKELYWSRTCLVNARTLQALTRERPSTILASTTKIVTVERTTKVVAVK